MAFWSKIFKKDKKVRTVEGVRNVGADKEVPVMPDKKTSRLEQAQRSIGPNIMAGVIRVPRITERTSMLAKENKYVFLVDSQANKVEIARAVRARYGVDIRSVNIINIPGKERRRGRQIGWKPGFKKAIVKVKEGQTIEIQ